MLDLIEYNALRFHLSVQLDRVDGHGRIKISGWICCRAEIFKLNVRLNAAEFQAPVGYPRPDVYKAINPDRRYPFMNSYFSGVDSEFRTDNASLVGGLKCMASMVDRKGTLFAEIPFEFDAEGKANLYS